MKRFLFTVSAIALALSAGSAFAADLPSRKEAPVYVPPPPPPPLWTGFYGWSEHRRRLERQRRPTTAICPIPTRHTLSAARRSPARRAPNLFFLPGGGTHRQ